MNKIEFVGASGTIYVAWESLGSYYIMEKSEYEKPVWNERKKKRIADAKSLKDCENCARWL